jgi:hypothetical protein
MGELIQWGLLQFVSAALLLVFTIIVLLVLSWELTLVVLLVMPIIIIASIRFQRQSNRAYLDVREKVGQNLSTLQEGITGVRVIQAYHRQGEQMRRFNGSNRALYDAHLHTVRISVWYFGLVEFVGIFAIAIVVGVGGWLSHQGSIDVGTVAAFVLLIGNLFEPVQMLSQLYNTVQSAAASLHKLYGLIDAEPDVAEHPHPVEFTVVRQHLCKAQVVRERGEQADATAHEDLRRVGRVRGVHLASVVHTHIGTREDAQEGLVRTEDVGVAVHRRKSAALGGVHTECGVGHAERAEHPLLQERAEGLSREHLHEACGDVDTVLSFVEVLELVAVEDAAGGALACVGEQFLFDSVLRLDALPTRRVAHVGLGVGAPPFLAAHGFGKGEEVGTIGQTVASHQAVDAPLPEDLHRARVSATCLRVVGDRVVALEQHELDAETLQEDGHRQAHRASTNDHHRDGLPHVQLSIEGEIDRPFSR